MECSALPSRHAVPISGRGTLLSLALPLVPFPVQTSDSVRVKLLEANQAASCAHAKAFYSARGL